MRTKLLPRASLVLILFATISYAAIQPSTADFCWRNSKPRGVGTIPGQCSPTQDKIGLLCYQKCPNEFKRAGFDCHSKCPSSSGWRDDGLFCRLAQYGRGGGYPWKFGDPLNDSGMFNRCQRDNGRGNCEKNGLIVYPKCRPGYHNVGCCICRPNIPNCRAFGLLDNIDLSCPKKIIIGAPQVAQCPKNKVYDAGLCYQKCPEGYKGVGPVCWAGSPKDWVQCGMGAAVDQQKCANVIFDQVSSVGALALNLATLGASASARAAVKAGKDASKILELKDKLKAIKQIYEKGQEVADIIRETIQNRPKDSKLGDEAKKIQTAKIDDMTPQDIVRLTAELAALLDPTGIADVVASYAYPTCDKIKVK